MKGYRNLICSHSDYVLFAEDVSGRDFWHLIDDSETRRQATTMSLKDRDMGSWTGNSSLMTKCQSNPALISSKFRVKTEQKGNKLRYQSRRQCLRFLTVTRGHSWPRPTLWPEVLLNFIINEFKVFTVVFQWILSAFGVELCQMLSIIQHFDKHCGCCLQGEDLYAIFRISDSINFSLVANACVKNTLNCETSI